MSILQENISSYRWTDQVLFTSKIIMAIFDRTRSVKYLKGKLGMKVIAYIFSAIIALPVSGEKLLKWQPHDLQFESSQDHQWWEFPVQANFTKEGYTGFLTVEGFWDGGNRWKIRTVLTEPGIWTWATESEDAELNGLRGTIEVIEPEIDQVVSNPNLRGSIKISESNNYFEYSDGTPFLMLASTLWAGNTARCGLGTNQDGPFYQHLNDRKSKGFNTILMQYFHGYGDYKDSLGHRNEGGKPYSHVTSKELNPRHFQFLDVRMNALWELGFVLATPTTWWGKTENCIFTPEDALRMSAYCAVRYGAFNSIWSLSGEYQYAFQDCGWNPADFTALGEKVQQHNPFQRPLSIHPSGRIDWPPPHNIQSSKPFHGETWIDHHWLQTGQSGDRLFNIVTRLTENKKLTRPGPIFCSEAYYEHVDDSLHAYLTRWQVWTALLNGASGFGYGAQGLWQFYDPSDPTGEVGKDTGRDLPWHEAQQLEGAGQVTHARSLLEQLEWWKLMPASDQLQIDGNPNSIPSSTDISHPQAAQIEAHTWILYFPRGNEGRTIANQSEIEGSLQLVWMNPRTGSKTQSQAIIGENGRLIIPQRPSPSTEDWVCIIKRQH